jgi:hypothetical protein
MNIDQGSLFCSLLSGVIVGLIFPIYLSPSGVYQGIDQNVKLVFNIYQERDIYDQSDYGEPPQFAIWLEDSEKNTVTTVFVTHRTGTGGFDGKVECPVSLPIWIGVFRTETGRDDFPRPWNPFYDGVTGATPKVEEFEVFVDVKKGVTWFYYIEMNVAGDYNEHFPSVSSDKHPDNHGNGQPSIVFKGNINSIIGEVSIPELVGRSEQYYFTTEINPELRGIDLAKKVFSKIIVSCE